MDSSPGDFSTSTTGIFSRQPHVNFSASFVSDQLLSAASFSLTSSKPSVLNFLEACFGFQFFLNTVFLGILCIFGFVGNTTSFLVFQRDRHNRVPVFLLQSLAVADNSVLCTAFLALSIFYGLDPVLDQETKEQARPYLYRYVNPLACAAQSCTIWMTVLLAINRYFAVCRPFTTQKWLTMTHARIQVGVVVLFSVLFNIPRVFDMDIRRLSAAPNSSSFLTPVSLSVSTSSSSSSSNTVEAVTNVPEAYWYFEVVYLNVFYTSVVLILPILLLVGFNVPLLHQMQTSKRRMIQNSLSYSGQQEKNITVVMVIIILEMIVCHSPDRVVQIIRIFVSQGSGGRACPSPFYYATNVANVLVILNSSTDFIVYYVFRTRFRTILCDQMLLCRRPRSDSRDVIAWNSRTDQGGGGGGANPLLLLNVNGSQEPCPVQGIDGDDPYGIRKSSENGHQTTSLVRKKNSMVTTEHDNCDGTSVIL